MAMACKVKKNIMQDKIKTINDKKTSRANPTYAAIARNAASAVMTETTKQTQIVRIDKETELKTLVSVLHAHIHNMIIPGTFQTELTKNLQKHELPTIETEDNPPSNRLFNVEIDDSLTLEQRKKILANTTPTEHISETPHRTQQDILPRQIEMTPKPQRTTIQREKLTSMDMTDDETILNRHTQGMTEAINAGEADATLIVRKTDYKGKDLSPDEVRRMFIDGRIKFRLDYDSEMTPDMFELR